MWGKVGFAIFEIEQPLLETLSAQNRLVLTAPTGSGESTQAPCRAGLDARLRAAVLQRRGERERRESFVNKLDPFVFCRVPVGADRIFAVLHRENLLVQKFTEHDDAAVAFAQVFDCAIGDRALSFPGHVILAGEIVQVKLAILVFSADKFDRRIFGLLGYIAVFSRVETELIDLRI